MRNSFFKRDISEALKGIALIFMMIHHFFTIPEWYIPAVSYPYLGAFARYLYAPLKICIPLFAFLTGYFYWLAPRKTVRYSLRKITDLVIPHSIVCVLMTLLAVALGCFRFTPGDFVMELLGLPETVMKFSWYVLFYCISMLMLPLLDKMSSEKLTGDIFLLLVLPVMAIQGLMIIMDEQFHISIPYLFGVLESVREWLPCIMCGYLFGKYSLFETYFENLQEKFSGKAGKILFWLCLCGIGFAGRLAIPRFQLGSIHPAGVWKQLVFTMDIFYAPLFAFGMAKLLETVKIPGLTKVLGAIGKKSLYMWFLHAMFFNCCREYLQPLVYFPKNPLLVMLLGVAACYILACLLDFAIKPVLKFKNKYL